MEEEKIQKPFVDDNGIERNFTTDGSHRVDADRTSRDFISFHESTRDPIFLFQKRVISGVNAQSLSDDEYYHDGDTLWIDAEKFSVEEIKLASKEDRMLRQKDDDNLPFEIGISISDNEMVENDWASCHWDTERVFRTREEAVSFGVGQKHNYGSEGTGWRVYCVCAEGELAKVLSLIDRRQVVQFLSSQDFRDALVAWTKKIEAPIYQGI